MYKLYVKREQIESCKIIQTIKVRKRVEGKKEKKRNKGQ